MSKPDQTNYFDSPSNSPSGNDSKLVINGTSKINGVDYTAEELQSSLSSSAVTTGWASYIDTQYPDALNALTISANTPTKLPNNALNTVDFNKPSDVDEFWDAENQKITGRNGDGLGITLFFFAVPTATNQSIEMHIDITGGSGTPSNLSRLYPQTIPFPKGAGVERGISFDVTAAYTLGTWEANGGDIYIQSSNDFDVYGMIFNFVRTHKG